MQNANTRNVNKIKNVNKYINASDERLHDAAAVAYLIYQCDDSGTIENVQL